MNAWDDILLGQKLLIIYLGGLFVFVALVAIVFMALALREARQEKAIKKRRTALMSVMADIAKNRRRRKRKAEQKEKKGENKMKKNVITPAVVLAVLAVAGIIVYAIVGSGAISARGAAILSIIIGAAAGYAACVKIIIGKYPRFKGEIILTAAGLAAVVGVLFAPLEARLFIAVLAMPLLLAVFAAILLGIKFRDKLARQDGGGERGIVYQVPNNHRWVLRNVWWSNPNTLEGYQAKAQGYRIKIPWIWHKDEGLVSLIPVQEDPQAFTVNCTDGNPVEVDARVTFYVRDEEINGKHASLYYTINTKGDDAHQLVHQRVKVALNRAMNTYSEKAISWTKKQKEKFGRDATIIINKLLRDDKPEAEKGDDGAEGKDYGLAAIINVQNIRPTEVVQAAKERETAAGIEREAAKAEAEAVFEIIKKTKANPTAVVVVQTIADMIRPLFDKDSGGGEKE